MKKQEDILVEFYHRLETIADKQDQLRYIIDFIIIYGDSFGNRILPIFDRGIALSKEVMNEGAEMIFYYNLLFFRGIAQGAMESPHFDTMPPLPVMAEKINRSDEWRGMGLNQLAFFHWFKGEFEIAFDIIFKALKFSEKIKDISAAWNYFTVAVFYFDTKDFKASASYYQKSFDLFELLNHEYGKARSMNGLGSVAIIQNRTADALPSLEYAAKTYRNLNHYSGLSRALNDMGMLEKALGNYDKAIVFLNESVELRTEIGHVQGLMTSYTELGEALLLKKEYASALLQFEKGLDLALRTKTQQKQIRLHKLLYDVHKELGNTELALRHFEQFFEIKSQLLSDEANNNMKRIQSKYEKEKSEREAEMERQKNIELAKANEIIEQKNKDITDSINYAKRIQISLLPTDKYIEKTIDRLKGRG